MTGRVSPEIAFLDTLWQSRIGQLGTAQRLLLGAHIAVAELIGQHQIGFGPYRYHGLVASTIVIMRQCRLLVTFNDRGVLVNGGNAHRLSRLGVELGDPSDHAGLNRLEALNRQTAGQDEGFLQLPSWPSLFQVLVMKTVQESSQGTDLGKLEAQTAFQALIAGEQLNVLRTIATDRLEQNQRFDIFGLRAAALALLEFKVEADQVGNFEGTKRAGTGQQSGMRAGHFLKGAWVQGEGRFMLGWDACCHACYIDISSIIMQAK